MRSFQGHWIYSKRDNCYLTMCDGVTLLRANATTGGGLDTTYQSVDWESLSKEEADRLASIAHTLWSGLPEEAKQR
jgi:hypothetical protein